MPVSRPPAPLEAFEQLLAGNRRFASGRPVHGQGLGPERRAELLTGQLPFAAVLACADSRTGPEHVFDAGLGELYVCRSAGALLDELLLGSLEYGVLHCGCPLVCVLGHSGCGACGAGVAAIRDPLRSESAGLDEVVRRVLPAVLGTWRTGRDEREWVDAASRANVELVCRQLLGRSRGLAARHREGNLEVVGMWYDLATGLVELVVPIVEVER